MKNFSLRKIIGLVLSVSFLVNAFTLNPLSVSAIDKDDPLVSPEISVTDFSSMDSPDLDKQNLTDANNMTYVDLSKTFGEASFGESDESQLANEAYVQSVISALAKPLGAIGFEEIPSSDTVDVIVWLQELPESLVGFYGEERISREAPFVEIGASARQTINSEFESNINFEYTEVFSGFGMTVPAAFVKRLADIEGVYAVIPDSMMHATEFTPDTTYSFIGMKESREILGISEIHEAGITGKGVSVGVLDTGIDYNHPDFKGSYKGGYNFIMPAADFYVRNRPNDDPMETTYEHWLESGQPETSASGSTFYTTHGTHVSGTVAAQALNNPNSVSKALGMAPDADLYVARVLGPYGSGATSGVIAAIEDFSDEGGNLPKMDVINLSLGSDFNTAYNPEIFVLNNAVIAGVNVAVSAGNNAGSTTEERALLTLGMPGTAYLPVTVAASQYGGTEIITYDRVTAFSDTGSETFSMLLEGQDFRNTFENNTIGGNPVPVYVEGKGYPVYLAFGPNDTNPSIEQLAAIPDNSLYGKILVVKRGLDFALFASEAKRVGAGALIVVNRAGDDAGERYITNMTISGLKNNHLPVFSAFHSTSAKLSAIAGDDDQLYLQLGKTTVSQQKFEPAYFSSIGPVTETIGIKPDIIAPGWNIISTQPAFSVNADFNDEDFSGAYGSKNGTSMSAPHIAGILALMKQAYPNATPVEIKARLMNTSKPDLIEALDDGTEASVFEVGAGFVDPKRAILDDKSVFVTVSDDIPGETPETPIENQTLASLNFGFAAIGGTSRQIPVRVHNTSSFSISVTYNDNTRYSNNASENGVVLKYDTPVGGRFNAWLEIPADAEKGLYEGRLVVTTGGRDYVLPWAVSTTEGYPDFEADFCVERPIISTSTNNNVRSSQYANATALFFWWDGLWPNGESDILLADPDTLEPVYYYTTIGPLGLGSGVDGVLVVSNIINYWAYPIKADGSLGDAEIIKNGAYVVAMSAGDSYNYSSGVVFSNEQPELIFDPIVPDMDPSVTTIKVTGRIFSKAIDLAMQRNFTYDELDFYLYGENVPVSQVYNVIAANAAVGILGTYSLTEGAPYLCDEDGYFEFTIGNVTQEEKLSGAYIDRIFLGYEPVGVDFYSYNYVGGWTRHGSNKSAVSFPVNKPDNLLSTLALNNENGTLTATINGAPENIDKSDFTLALTLDGVNYPTKDYSYELNAETGKGTAQWFFDPVDNKIDETQVIFAELAYNGVTLEAYMQIDQMLPNIYGDYKYFELINSSDVEFAMNLGIKEYLATDISKILISGSSLGIATGSALSKPDDFDNDKETLTIKADYLKDILEKSGDKIWFEVEFDNSQASKAGITIEAIPGYATVNFDSNGGTPVPAIKTEIGTKITDPGSVSREGYRFDGWYLDNGTFNKPWDFENDKVNENITLYAKWTKQILITFNSNGGSDVLSQILSEGQKIERPSDPIRNGYAFDNWYLDDESFQKPWDFEKDTAVSDTVLYAKWIKVHTVAFNSLGGTYIDPVFVLDGEKVVRPANPVRAGFDFTGWYRDTNLVSAWAFNKYAVTRNIVLYAGWEAKKAPSPAPTPTVPVQPPAPAASTPVPASGSGIFSTPIPLDKPIDINFSVEEALTNGSGNNVDVKVLRDTAVLQLSQNNIQRLIDGAKSLTINGMNISLALDTEFLKSLGLRENDSFEIKFSPSKVKAKNDVSKVDRANDRLVANAFDISIYVNGVSVNSFSSPISIKLSLKMLGLNDSQKNKLTAVRYNEDGTHVQLGGRLVSADYFEFKTSSLSKYGLLITDKIVSISAAIGRSTFTVNGESRVSDVAPFIKDGSTMVPIRFIAEAFGANVNWIDSTKSVVIALDGKSLSFKIGVLYEGMNTPAVIVDDRTYVPLRYVSERLDGNVIWHGDSYSIDITR